LLRDFGKRRNVVIEDYQKYEIGGTDLFKWSESSILQGREDFGDADLENRNMILISVAVSIIMSDRKREKTGNKKQGLIVGFKNEHYDTTRGFAWGLNQVLGQRDILVEIVTPLVEDDNAVGWHSLARQIHSINGAEALLSNTWSCYYPTSEGSPCTRCHPCISRGKLNREVGTQARIKSQEEQTA
jgi:7-cyano-7-deazaguanine synthase in queuosine biosynthesis